jgi:serine/threonine-protein kinase
VDSRARFEREAEVIARLEHPSIVRFHSLEEEGGLRFLTMELIEGSTLAQLLPAAGFPLDAALAIASDLASALSYAHRRGVVHRDLKLTNLMRTSSGGLKVLDFGLARLVEQAEAASALTSTGRVLGSIGYMAPEQILGEPVDERTDVFAFGAVVYELLAGRPPFTKKSLAAFCEAVLEPRPTPLETLRTDVPPAVAEAIHRCMAKAPADRPASIGG